MYRCDHNICEKALNCWDTSSFVVEDEGEAYTKIWCQQCYNERLQKQGRPQLKLWQWRAVVEKKAHRGRLWKLLVKDQLLRVMWAFFSLERAKAKKLLGDARKEEQEGVQGHSQQESPAKEVLKQVRGSAETDCSPQNDGIRIPCFVRRYLGGMQGKVQER